MPTDNEFTRILQWPGYRVYRHEIDEKNKILELWVRRKRGNRKLECSGCGRKFNDAYDCRERAVRDLPWSEFKTAVHVEVYRVKCPDCGVRVEKVPLLPSKAPFSKRFEGAVGQACESAAARQVARRFGLTETTVRAIDLRYLERWAATRREPPLRQMGVDEIYRGKNDKFLTVVSNLETGEPLWFGKERKKETLDGGLQRHKLSTRRLCKSDHAACGEWRRDKQAVPRRTALVLRSGERRYAGGAWGGDGGCLPSSLWSTEALAASPNAFETLGSRCIGPVQNSCQPCRRRPSWPSHDGCREKNSPDSEIMDRKFSWWRAHHSTLPFDRILFIQGQVELQHVHTRVAKQPK